ncbi:hypothetical protein EDB84DRAFT_1439814 [Lactarius hengduanensis]|nr:hypothetical protein EDB84DRAFT_1439814 [Lactarius hengduanensis]
MTLVLSRLLGIRGQFLLPWAHEDQGTRDRQEVLQKELEPKLSEDHNCEQEAQGPKPDENGHTENFAHPVLIELCKQFYYSGKSSSLSVLFPRHFKSLPAAALAMACTCVVNCLHEWESGSYVLINFAGATYESVYNLMATLIDRTLKDDYHGKKLRVLLKQIATEGRGYPVAHATRRSRTRVDTSAAHTFTVTLDTFTLVFLCGRYQWRVQLGGQWFGIAQGLVAAFPSLHAFEKPETKKPMTEKPDPTGYNYGSQVDYGSWVDYGSRVDYGSWADYGSTMVVSKVDYGSRADYGSTMVVRLTMVVGQTMVVGLWKDYGRRVDYGSRVDYGRTTVVLSENIDVTASTTGTMTLYGSLWPLGPRIADVREPPKSLTSSSITVVSRNSTPIVTSYPSMGYYLKPVELPELLVENPSPVPTGHFPWVHVVTQKCLTVQDFEEVFPNIRKVRKLDWAILLGSFKKKRISWSYTQECWVYGNNRAVRFSDSEEQSESEQSPTPLSPTNALDSDSESEQVS